jgi:hypothetical protein
MSIEIDRNEELNVARRLMGLNAIPRFRWYEILLKRTAWCPYCGMYLGWRWLWGDYSRKIREHDCKVGLPPQIPLILLPAWSPLEKKVDDNA